MLLLLRRLKEHGHTRRSLSRTKLPLLLQRKLQLRLLLRLKRSHQNLFPRVSPCRRRSQRQVGGRALIHLLLRRSQRPANQLLIPRSARAKKVQLRRKRRRLRHRKLKVVSTSSHLITQPSIIQLLRLRSPFLPRLSRRNLPKLALQHLVHHHTGIPPTRGTATIRPCNKSLAT